MARKPKTPGGNGGFNDEAAREAMEALDAAHARLLSLRGEYMRDCRVVRDEIADIFTEAKDKGVPKKELKAVHKARAMLAKAKEIIADLENDERTIANHIADALGEDEVTAPLFAHAVKRRKPRATPSSGGKPDADEREAEWQQHEEPADEQDLRPRHLREGSVDTDPALKP